MATVYITNPTYTKSKKTLRERVGKYKHRPVFYSQSADKLGTRSEFKKLNPKKGVSKMAAKKPKYRRKAKRSNPQRAKSSGVTKYKYRYKPTFRRAKKRRNPDVAGGVSVSSAAMVIGGGIAGAVGYKVTTGLFQTEGNGKYLVAIVLALGGGWLLSKFYRPLAVPFVAGVAGSAAIEYLSENDVLSGLLGSSYTPNDVGMLNEWKKNYDTGMLGLVAKPEDTMLGMAYPDNGAGVQLNNPAMYQSVSGGGGDKL